MIRYNTYYDNFIKYLLLMMLLCLIFTFFAAFNIGCAYFNSALYYVFIYYGIKYMLND